MRESLVEKLRCPVDLHLLHLDVSEQAQDGHVITGRLRCNSCGTTYPIEQGVAHLLPSDSVEVEGKDLADLQAATVERFGFEWSYFRDWGWLADYPDIPNAEERFYGGLAEHTRSAFWSKSLFREEDLHPGLLVLDAGCGNGRFTALAAQTGAEIIGMDLGWGVYSAFEHTRHLSNVHIVRGDILRLPFANGSFDCIFTIGVLQHTGNAEAAFDSLARRLRPGGLFAVRVYGRGGLAYETLDALMRAVTTRLPIRAQIAFSRLTSALARWLRGGKLRMRLYRHLFRYINLLPTEPHMYDWWSAPIASHYTLEEVLSWFGKHKLEVVRAKPGVDDLTAERLRRHSHGPISVLGHCPLA